MILLRIIPETYVYPEQQLLFFAGACLLGIPCGILWDAFRLFRKLIPHHSAAVAAEDILFPVICGVLISGYISGFAMGEFRMYHVIGCVLGFVLYECTLSRLVMGIGTALCTVLKIPFRLLEQGRALICRKVSRIFVESSKKKQKQTENTQITCK